jgi:hypothetical protein
LYINVREYRRGSQKRKIQINWQQSAFSTKKGIKKNLRSTMGDGRLSSLGMMLVHRSFDIGMEGLRRKAKCA